MMRRIRNVCAVTAAVMGGLFLATVALCTLLGGDIWQGDNAIGTSITCLWATCCLLAAMLPAAQDRKPVELTGRGS